MIVNFDTAKNSDNDKIYGVVERKKKINGNIYSNWIEHKRKNNDKDKYYEDI